MVEQEQGAAAQLARLLRRWWKEAGSPTGGTRPTQQALAARLGIDQTTLSRYLNPKHLSTAPLRVVETLHAQLRAPRRNSNGRGSCAGPRCGRTDASEPPRAPRSTPYGPVPEATGLPRPMPTGTRHRPPTVPAFPPGGTGPGGSGPSCSRRPWRWRSPRAWPSTRGSPPGTTGPRPRGGGAVPASKTPYEWPLLRRGEEDQFGRARALQHLLNAHGYEVRADGFFREDTQDAVMDFQERHDLPVDGKVGRQTWPELVKVVGHGSGASEVRAVQELLNNVGQGGTAVSGRFTEATAQDLRFFQRTHGLAATGRVTVDTWLALLVEQLPPVKAPAYQRGPSPLPSASV
ncbi:peptidoglycan-binding protein [Streptomyces diastatochromogenes]|nr:peptidoglycan-binding protein [Streptomyces diastatochromogenes]